MEDRATQTDEMKVEFPGHERSPEAKAALSVMQNKLSGKSGRILWKSFEELANTPEFRTWADDEFPNREVVSQVDRRTFLKLGGAAMAMAGLSGCRILPNSKAVAYVRAPEEMVSGLPLTYATTLSRAGYGIGVLVETTEGRPVKVEGNPTHPASLGSTLAQEQAECLNLYDPDRSQSVANRKSPGESNPLREDTSWDQALNIIRRELINRAVSGGTGFALLTETITSPTLIAQIETLRRKYPQMRWVQYDPLGRENVHEGTRLAFGRALNPVYRLKAAKVIVSLDADFFQETPGGIRYARDFSDGRRVRKARPTMNRLYTVESSYTIAGASADHRIPVKPSQIEAIARYLFEATANKGGNTPAPQGLDAKVLAAMAADLAANPGAAVVVPGEQCSPAVHALCAGINAALGAIGSTVVYTPPVESGNLAQTAALKELVDEMNAGRVQLLTIVGGNPVYNAPTDLKFADALLKVPVSVRLGLYEDETSEYAAWHLPMSHPFEAWGDLRAFDGTASIVQPLIAPLYSTRSAVEFLADLNDNARTGFEIVQDHWRGQARAANFENWWEKALHEGVVPNTALPPVAVTPTAGFEGSLPAVSAPGQFEVAFRPDPSLYDGRFANNSWLQECPKPISTVCWDNVAHISPKTAKELGFISSQEFTDAAQVGQVNGKKVIKLTVNGQVLNMPLWVLPGQPDGVVTAHLGFGRTRAGVVGDNVGQNVYRIRTVANMAYAAVQVEAANMADYDVVSTQAHHVLHVTEKNFAGKEAEEGNRDIVRLATIQDYVAKNGVVFEIEHGPEVPEATAFPEEHKEEHKEEPFPREQGAERPADYFRRQWDYADRSLVNKEDLPSLYPEFSYKGFNAWGMSIDLTTCIGCNTCLMACQAENNIPTVGKEQIGRGREMHWLRIDHYYESDTNWENVVSHFQPLMCVHCEKAPCEPVCPVAATVHSHEGINQMVYNRCIGTRYCSNNCPYKVRRFNYLKWTAGIGGPKTINFELPVLRMLANPDVTVRGRGVMEKCTYCVQRISRVRIEAKKAGREIEDGEIITACQQACPTNAIIFGDLNNPNSAVTKLRQEPHDYSLLAELNTRPRTGYLARLTNPNEALGTPGGAKREGAATEGAAG